MPVILDTPGTPGSRARDGAGAIEIGLVNNFSDMGLESGERQILDLLEAAAGPTRVRLRLYALPSIPRGPEARARIETIYHGFDALLRSDLDGLFVTGAEPRTNRLSDEAFWPHFTQVVDWAATHTRSTIWSCLAAHAAVLHLDGIARRPLPQKCTGVFAVEPASDHMLLAGAGPALHVCHSRWNDVAEADLVASGYEILTRAAVGVDAFAKPCGSLFVFLQGHPEYDAGALGREYRRDAARFLSGMSDSYPTLPHDYFSADEETALLAFGAEARRLRDPAAVGRYPLNGAVDTRGWRRALAATLFRNWLQSLDTADIGTVWSPARQPSAAAMSRPIRVSAGRAAATMPVRP